MFKLAFLVIDKPMGAITGTALSLATVYAEKISDPSTGGAIATWAAAFTGAMIALHWLRKNILQWVKDYRNLKSGNPLSNDEDEQ